MASFNLIEKPCIRVLRVGRVEEVSIREAVTEAHLIDQLSFQEPLQAVAMLRQVLLPIVIDAFNLPMSLQDWQTRWEAGCFDAEVLHEYLALPDCADRFDLFGPRAFAQAPGLATASGEIKSVSLLIPEVASGNNVPLFSVYSDADPPVLPVAGAFGALLAAHCWDTAGIKSGASDDPVAEGGKTVGNPTGPLGQLGVVIPLGTNLFETLMLNIPVTPDGLRPGDIPQWRQPNPQTGRWRGDAPEPGLLTLLTWQSRRIRLHPSRSQDAAMAVHGVVVATGDRLGPCPETVEIHTMWRSVDVKTARPGPRVRPVRHPQGGGAWQGLPGLLAVAEPTDRRVSTTRLLAQIAELARSGILPADFALRVASVGVTYGNQSAVVEDVVSDVIPLPVAALLADGTARAVLLAIVRDADRLRSALKNLEINIARACSTREVDRARGQRIGDSVIHAFIPLVRRILAILQARPERSPEVYAAWVGQARRLVWQNAEPMLNNAPPQAFAGRERYTLAGAERRFIIEISQILGPAPGKEAPRKEAVS